ncbi:DNA polymerase III subunit alpha [Aquibacillus halophilus]|uniref:DNA polymerase III subunit alpha n=1 Tax=Aquibacillus halophilus TaxID=930132 RepID=A0A6A8DGM1_9BACI|nr:DNA polymerase III subunit alpha [Aquibacillus halophilus]MRH42871.1 DNA polymerase III subunit alpha [Aquibacillus halophilus]
MEFTHLQIRSGYSLMKSSVMINKLVKRAKELNFKSLALTDEHVMHGAISFYQTCQKFGIKPILGMTVLLNDDNNQEESCVLLAENGVGYQNLLKLSTHIQLQEQELVSKVDLKEYLSGLVMILPLSQSPLLKLLNDDREKAFDHISSWKSLVSDNNFYLGVESSQQFEADFLGFLKDVCKERNIRAAVVGDVRYINKNGQVAYECLQAMREGNKWADNKKMVIKNQHLSSQQEIEDLFNGTWPELLIETEKISKRCNVELDLNRRMIPSYPVPTNESTFSYLESLCFKRLDSKFAQGRQEAETRLTYELEIIKKMDFSDYFLIVWDFIQYSKEQGIMVGPGRGSAAGSVVAYLLGITNVDPIEYGLLFERFLNPERVTMPDIDIDFSDHRRDEVIQYVKNKYGAEHVAQIVTFGTFAARSLLRELIKTLEIDQQDAEFILKEIPTQTSKSISDSVKASTELTDYVRQSSELQTLFRIAIHLEGLPRHVSTHAAGVIISQKPLVEHVPLISSGNDIYLTQFAMKELEAVGLLKMDFLGLRNLTLLERIVQSIKLNKNKTIVLEKIPLDDYKTFSLLQKGMTNGVFQLESQGMQQVLTNLKPTHFEDVVAVNALYRPGPMEYIPVYINRKHGHEPVSYPHQDLIPILEQTYGVLVYQEQIMQIANKVAGYTLGQADILRRAVSKKQSELMLQQQDEFIKGCTKNGYSKEVADEIFNWIVRFSNYGFNRSHAVAYSMISYQLAYLKTHYPPHFLAEVLTSVAGQHEKIRLYIREAKEFKIEVLQPSINKSFSNYIVDSGNIRIGLMTIKGVGHQVVREIIRVRKDGYFKHLFDFCLRVPLNIVNRQVIESLVLAGAFDETNTNRASLLATIDQAIEQGELFREFEDQPSFFQGDIELDASFVDTEPFSKMKQLSYEKELLGIYVSSHPLAEFRDKLRSNGILNLTELKANPGKNNMKSSAVIQEIKSIRTKRGDPMAFITLGDERDDMEAVLFPEVYRNVHRWLEEEVLVSVKGKVENRNGRTQLLISDIEQFKEEKLERIVSQQLFVKVMDDNHQLVLDKIKAIANKFPGDMPVIIYQEHKKTTYQLSSSYYIKYNQASLKEFYKEFGQKNVALKNIR